MHVVGQELLMNYNQYGIRRGSDSTLRALSAVLLCVAGVLGSGLASIVLAADAPTAAPVWSLDAGTASATPRQKSADSATVESLVDAATAGDQARLVRVAAELKTRPKPPRGDRRLARSLNDRGLALWQRQRFAEAAVLFRQAHDADPSDVEIRENLGYALLKSGKVVEAKSAVLSALELAPERASAWGSLGLIQAKQGLHSEAVAYVITAYGYARDRKRALDVYRRLAATDPDPKVRAVLGDVVARLTTVQ